MGNVPAFLEEEREAFLVHRATVVQEDGSNVSLADCRNSDYYQFSPSLWLYCLCVFLIIDRLLPYDSQNSYHHL